MNYREIPPSPALEGLIKTFWTLEGSGPADGWIEQQATPDGCVEIIRRFAGRSRWGEAQPERFAVGLVEAPQSFAISGDARFAGVRLWPWAWPLVGAAPLEAMRGRWIPFDGAAANLLPDFAAIEHLLAGNERLAAVGRAIVAAGSVAEMGASGMEPRALQRWFARHVGMPPRRYLRLLRFQKAFEGVGDAAPLAAQAADHGFADQAHMARTFRELAGVPAKQARRSARGPFLT